MAIQPGPCEGGRIGGTPPGLLGVVFVASEGNCMADSHDLDWDPRAEFVLSDQCTAYDDSFEWLKVQ